MSDRALSGQTAVIGGASGAIGGAVARELAKRGASLLLLGRDAGRLDRLVADLRDLDGDVQSLPADLGDERGWSRVEAALGALSGIDILVHAQGYFSAGSLTSATVEEIDRVFLVNFRSPPRLTRLCLPSLVERQGQVVFVNSSAGARAGGANSAYVASKQALRVAADGLRDEVNAKGVRVLSIFPGRTAGAMQREVCRQLGSVYDPERMLAPSDVATMVAEALCLPRTAEVTDIHIRPMRGPAS
jgi:NADP-dependent 3-hydroxy acid dehydrogenase YdfG